MFYVSDMYTNMCNVYIYIFCICNKSYFCRQIVIYEYLSEKWIDHICQTKVNIRFIYFSSVSGMLWEEVRGVGVRYRQQVLIM